MGAAKHSLQQAVERLTEEQARQVLGLIDGILRTAPGGAKLSRETLRQRLADDPNVTIPPSDATAFEDFPPADTSGPTASQLLISDRQ